MSEFIATIAILAWPLCGIAGWLCGGFMPLEYLQGRKSRPAENDPVGFALMIVPCLVAGPFSFLAVVLVR